MLFAEEIRQKVDQVRCDFNRAASFGFPKLPAFSGNHLLYQVANLLSDAFHPRLTSWPRPDSRGRFIGNFPRAGSAASVIR
jgi:hypothetical protein